MEDLAIISADSHVVEPPTLWVERLDKKYRNRAPHTVRGYAGNEGEWFVTGRNARIKRGRPYYGATTVSRSRGRIGLRK